MIRRNEFHAFINLDPPVIFAVAVDPRLHSVFHHQRSAPFFRRLRAGLLKDQLFYADQILLLLFVIRLEFQTQARLGCRGILSEQRHFYGKARLISYKQERGILNTLIDKIFNKNQEKFKEREDVFEIFAKAMLTGNILPIGRLIDETFGRGTFKKYGDLDKRKRRDEKKNEEGDFGRDTVNAQEEFVKSL